MEIDLSKDQLMRLKHTSRAFFALSHVIMIVSLSCKKAEESGTQKVYKPIGSEAEFFNNIDDYYDKLSTYWKRREYFIAISYLDYFIQFNRLDYKDVRSIGIAALEARLEEPLISKAEKELYYERLIKLDPSNKEEYLNKILSKETPEISPIVDEKSALRRDTFFGDFRNPIVHKRSGEVSLEVWRPYVQWVTQTFIPKVSGALLQGSQRLDVTYDEIWVWENKEADVSKLYWKNNKIQAATFAEYYIGNPVTNMPLATSSYKIANIYNREYIINKLLQPN